MFDLVASKFLFFLQNFFLICCNDFKLDLRVAAMKSTRLT